MWNGADLRLAERCVAAEPLGNKYGGYSSACACGLHARKLTVFPYVSGHSHHSDASITLRLPPTAPCAYTQHVIAGCSYKCNTQYAAPVVS